MIKMVLYLILSFNIIFIGLSYLIFSIYLFLRDKPYDHNIYIILKIFSTISGMVLIILGILLIIYTIINLRKSSKKISVELSNISDNIYPLSTLDFRNNNPEIDILIRMIFSTFYDGVRYNGGNFRGGRIKENDFYTNTYINFFSKEYLEVLTKEDKIYIQKTDINDNNFNDNRIILIWKLYKNYMENRYNHNNLINNLRNYIFIIMKINDINFEEDIMDKFILINMAYIKHAYISVYKLIHRKLIQNKYGVEILDELDTLLNYMNKYSLTENIRRDIKISIEKENNKTNYYPVILLHENGIIFN